MFYCHHFDLICVFIKDPVDETITHCLIPYSYNIQTNL